MVQVRNPQGRQKHLLERRREDCLCRLHTKLGVEEQGNRIKAKRLKAALSQSYLEQVLGI